LAARKLTLDGFSLLRERIFGGIAMCSESDGDEPG
jgi:hypothetical protein